MLSCRLFADPAWDILLDLFAARAEMRQVSVSSACIAACVPISTALRWLSELEGAGLIQRVRDDNDGRRTFILINDEAADAVERWLNGTFVQ